MSFTFFRKDILTFQDKDYIGTLRSVSIKKDERGQYPGWYLETVNNSAILKSTDSWYQHERL